MVVKDGKWRNKIYPGMKYSMIIIGKRYDNLTIEKEPVMKIVY